jgi:hypothetical protein
MLLKELKRFPKRPVENDSEYGIDAGRYIGIKFTPDSKRELKNIIDNEGIPNYTDTDDLHSTIAYSKGSNIPGYQVAGKMEKPVEAEIDCFDIFKDQSGKNCLVAKLNAPDLEQLHNKTREHGATHDYDEYIPHVTLSYDAGDINNDLLNKLTKKYKGTKIFGEEEYDSEIIKNWADKNKK